MEIILSIVILVFLFDLLNCSAGMGLGTLTAPVLFLMGYSTMQIIPVLVIAAAVSGWISGWFHHEFENVNFSFRTLNPETKVLALIAGIGCTAILLAVFLAHFWLRLPEAVIKIYVAILVLGMGFLGLVGLRKRRAQKFRPKLLPFFAALAGLNKGIGGGGYGPVVVLGEVLSGVYEKTAAAIVSLSEGIVSTVGAIAFFGLMAAGVSVDLVLLPSIFTGTFFAAILAPYLVRVFPNKVWRFLIPAYALSIGTGFLVKMFLW